MAVTSQELRNGEPIPQAAPQGRSPAFAAAVMLLLFGVPLWLVGARYTFDGWMTALNMLLAWLRLPLWVPSMDWRLYFVIVIALGVLYSRVEVRMFGTARRGRALAMPGFLWALWVLVLLSDVGSTFLGVITPAPDSWPITRWVAATWPAAGTWSVVLTFLPEWLIIGAMQLLRR